MVVIRLIKKLNYIFAYIHIYLKSHNIYIIIWKIILTKSYIYIQILYKNNKYILYNYLC